LRTGNAAAAANRAEPVYCDEDTGVLLGDVPLDAQDRARVEPTGREESS